MLISLAIRSSTCQSKNSANRLSSINVLLLSLLWLTVPITIWVLSHISPVNLFKDRYFIPIEVALIVLLSFCINRLFKISSNIHSTKFNITILSSTTLLSVFSLIGLSTPFLQWIHQGITTNGLFSIKSEQMVLINICITVITFSSLIITNTVRPK